MSDHYMRFFMKKPYPGLFIYLFFVFYFKNKKISTLNPRLVYYLSFILLYLAFANFLSNLPSGSRYLVISYFLIFPLILYVVTNVEYDKWIYRVNLLTSPLLLFFFLVRVREGFYFVSSTTIFGNPIVALFTMGDNVPLDVLIK
ncbi:hypothetical protein A3SI_06809 [Nitritalea halalkaliphila LW7]|uniref:Uncharacterized protein n=1 Tax=Nitritalea halalkaliphila LW7 TaxID=1189621 RepID=I5C625_9BACT|nr:hypothetical protein A3SI_06809 [Nitritalea halalkaliphila LW7]